MQLCYMDPILYDCAILSLSCVVVPCGPHPEYLCYMVCVLRNCDTWSLSCLPVPLTTSCLVAASSSHPTLWGWGCPQWVQCHGTGVPAAGTLLWDWDVHSGHSAVGLGCPQWEQCCGTGMSMVGAVMWDWGALGGCSVRVSHRHSQLPELGDFVLPQQGPALLPMG